NLVLEAACFNHSSIRRTAYKHKLSTDSSYRFERHLAPETAESASVRAAQLILELAGGTLCQGTLDDWQTKQENAVLQLRPGRFKQVIGISLAKDEIVRYLSRLGLTYLGEGSKATAFPKSEKIIPEVVKDSEQSLYYKTQTANKIDLSIIDPLLEALYFQIPPKRIDLTREIDLIEEVIRLHGMDKATLATVRSLIMDRHAFSVRRKISEYMIQNGFQEIVNLSFTDPELIKNLKLSSEDGRLNQIELLNPQNSNLSVLRSSLLPQLLLTAHYNLNHDVQDLKLYELNKIFLENNSLPKLEQYRLNLVWSGRNHPDHWKFKSREANFFEVKGMVEGILKLAGLTDITIGEDVSGYLMQGEAQSMCIKDKCVAELGKLNPEIAAGFDLDTVELKQDFWLAEIDLDRIIELSRDSKSIYEPVPRFPSVQRDLSFLIKTGVSFAEIKGCIEQVVKESMLSLFLFDEYKGKQVPEGFRSLTFRFVFNNPEKTLTDDEVDTLIEKIVKELKEKWDIQVR
ncbi:MAG: phenylalanine--tRNA ligase subunit beta, partial [Candidatus Cloacimonadaceae bacterium]